MPVRITATLVSRRLSSTILALRSPLGARCLRSDQAITRRATMALSLDTAHAAAKRRMIVRALTLCYTLSFQPRYRQGSPCHKPSFESLPCLYAIDSGPTQGLLLDTARQETRSEGRCRGPGVLHHQPNRAGAPVCCSEKDHGAGGRALDRVAQEGLEDRDGPRLRRGAGDRARCGPR